MQKKVSVLTIETEKDLTCGFGEGRCCWHNQHDDGVDWIVVTGELNTKKAVKTLNEQNIPGLLAFSAKYKFS